MAESPATPFEVHISHRIELSAEYKGNEIQVNQVSLAAVVRVCLAWGWPLAKAVNRPVVRRGWRLR